MAEGNGLREAVEWLKDEVSRLRARDEELTSEVRRAEARAAAAEAQAKAAQERLANHLRSRETRRESYWRGAALGCAALGVLTAVVQAVFG